RLDFRIPARGLIGFQTEFLTMTSGSGLIYHVFDAYGPKKSKQFGQRKNGVLISNGAGKALGFAIFNLQERGKMMISPSQMVYQGQVVGIHSRENDLTVNPLKGKQLTNVRASGKDDAIQLVPPIKHSLEAALEFIDDDELVEITPDNIRIRKKYLQEHERKRASRESKAEAV
ncbi:MAG: translational GTPase TypA, partial [Pseudomonadota bacterium]